MQYQIYEILDQFKQATTHDAKMWVLRRNDCKMLREVLAFTFDPNIQFFTKTYPPTYKADRDAPPGMGFSHLGVEMRKMYLFIKNHPASRHLTDDQKNHLLLQLLESLEPREAEIVMCMFQKFMPANDLTFNMVKEAFPNL